MMRSLKLALLLGGSALYGAATSFGAITYSQLSTTGLTTSTATVPTVLEDVNLSGSVANPQELTALTFGYGDLAGTTAQTGAVFVDFYDTFNAASTGAVVSDYIGGFGGTLSIPANTGTTTSLRSTGFTGLNTLTTPIFFKDNNIAVVFTFTDSSGQFYSTVVTPLLSGGTPTVGTSTAGVYRDTNGDGTFQSTELTTTTGSALYLSVTTVAVPEPSSVVLMSLGGAALLGGMYRLRRRQA